LIGTIDALRIKSKLHFEIEQSSIPSRIHLFRHRRSELLLGDDASGSRLCRCRQCKNPPSYHPNVSLLNVVCKYELSVYELIHFYKFLLLLSSLFIIVALLDCLLLSCSVVVSGRLLPVVTRTLVPLPDRTGRVLPQRNGTPRRRSEPPLKSSDAALVVTRVAVACDSNHRRYQRRCGLLVITCLPRRWRNK